jgi:Domain of Unknown Function (DUF1080)
MKSSTIVTLSRRTRVAAVALTGLISIALRAETAAPPAGFVSLFNGKDLSGWYGRDTENPQLLDTLTPEALAAHRQQTLVDPKKGILAHWKVADGVIENDGHGLFLTTEKSYGDFELRVEYKTAPGADSGIYLRGCPQVQIWDRTAPDPNHNGNALGSGGLWNNSKGAPGKDPTEVADKPAGEWNSFKITMIGQRVTVVLNDKKVVDNAVLENYFDRKRPVFATGPIQLQTHGAPITWRNVWLREISGDEAGAALSQGETGFTPLFNGKDLTGWQGGTDSYEVVDGVLRGKAGKGGALYTKDEYSNYTLRFDFKLPPKGNNGIAIHYPGAGDPAYAGMTELQVLDSEHPYYNSEPGGYKIDPRQAHGSAYGLIAAQRGYLRPQGQWNTEEITVQGSKVKVELNGTVILDGDVSTVPKEQWMGGSMHPGITRRSGYIGFAGHNDPVEFRHVRIKKN